ncbi:hypothetical protein ACOSZF_21695 [Cytobacillus firmus]|uniref:hypothetical protein n=1 Tax=Cytobacillus firmus TaxID=1399 RepID=UPI003BA02257
MLNYEIFMKHAEKVCSSPHLDAVDRHQILKGVKHFENGDAIATDSHRLYLARGVHNREDEAVISPAGKVLSGNYPDVKRIIPTNDPSQEIGLSVADLLEASNAIYGVGSVIEETPRMDFVEDSIRYDSVHVKYQRTLPDRFEERMCVNAKYVLDAVRLFKAASCQNVSVKFYGRMRPFTLANEDESLIVLILPIRKY